MVKKETQECIHHWVIETAYSRNSNGICKKCKLEKVFYNSIDVQDIKGSWSNTIKIGKGSLKGENNE